MVPPTSARTAQEQHEVLGYLQRVSAQYVLASSVLPSHGHPLASDRQVLVRVNEPQRPQVSLQVPALQVDHSPPGVHGIVVVVVGATVVGAVVHI